MIYGILSTIVFLLIMPFWLFIGIFKPKLTAGFMEKMGFYPNLDKITEKKSKTIAFYGVSVGEVIAMENLIKKTRETFPEIKIILFTGTKTGQEIANKKLSKTADFITYFPFDFPFCIQNMLKKLSPDAIFVMETELWPNFANVINKKKIPLFIINGRISDRTYKSYKKLSFFFAPILKKYTNIFTQSKQDNDKLVSIGANPDTTEIMGNLKFDIKKPDTVSLGFEKNPNHKILLAGSTHSGEDEIVLEYFTNLKNKLPNLKLIIAPRHPERNNAVYELIQKTGFSSFKRSETVSKIGLDSEETFSPFEKKEIMLLDTMGELGKFYSIADVAFIGGSFNKTGGHNPLEATIFQKPVVSGLSIHNFKDIYALLTNTEAGFVADKKSVENRIEKLLTDEVFYQKASEDCEKIFEQNKGALSFVIKVLQKLV